MKYTVVIEQAVPEEQQAQLQQALASRFQLSADQARKLATRRGGRLMKPTGRERAAVLLEIFKEVNAQVRLEQVAEAAELPGAVPAAAPLLGRSPTPLSLNQTDLHATEFGQTVLPREPGREQSVATLDSPVMVARAEPGFSGTSAVSAVAAASLVPATDNFWDELAAPAFRPSATNTSGGLFMPDTGSQPESRLSEAQPVLASQPGGVLASTDLLGLGSLSTSRSSLGSLDSAPADSWSDFTGALTMTETPAAPKVADEAPEMLMQSTEHDTPLGRRQPLLRRLTVASVTPLAVYTVLTLSTLSIVLTSSQRSLISTSAATIAAAVGSVLNTTDQNTVNQQLGTLLNRQSVGFVQVELPDGTTFFRSQSPGLDAVLGERVGTWVKSNPSSGVFVQNDTPAQLYDAQLQQLISVGAQDSEPAAALKRAVNNPDNQTISNRNFQVERIGVYAKPDGSRETRGANEKSTNPLLYRIAVGVPIDSAQTQLRNTLLILLVAGLLAMLLGAALAARAARRIVQPIERLVTAADAISLGNLSQSVKAESNDEVGDLAQALERMRLSLDAAMERLRKRRKT
ncbi:HAMP domain-containing protein [Deinococcus rubellus]|uniref:HAMP domain-containing protein n=1 Tax=Deinococcus rubellus TaxID=1889240 RepID=A0ABY5YCD4_9DEIO|nr:HAMP domain-containing protein [Deinococcus rubellus]UWX62714.1 HAMP domain-containing protein [Deinococcus rubellus]